MIDSGNISLTAQKQLVPAVSMRLIPLPVVAANMTTASKPYTDRWGRVDVWLEKIPA